MAYLPHILVQFGGPMDGGPEIWSTGFRAANYGDYTQAQLKDYLDGDLKDHVSSFITTTAHDFSSSTQLAYVKANRIGPDGKYVDPISNTYEFTGTLPQGAQTPNMPYQVSVVVSLRGVGRGPATHGRMYLPSQSLTVEADGSLEGDIPPASANAVKSLFSDVHGDDPGLLPALFSQKGPYGGIVNILCGSIPDTQRRRRNALVEDYYSTPSGLPNP